MSIYGYGLVCDAVRCSSAPIAAGLRDPASAVRAAAIDAAQRAIATAQAGSAALLAPLSAAMTRDRDPIVRARAAVALAAYAPPAPARWPAAATTAGRAVAAAFAHETNRTVRWHEAWALGRVFFAAPSRAGPRPPMPSCGSRSA